MNESHGLYSLLLLLLLFFCFIGPLEEKNRKRKESYHLIFEEPNVREEVNRGNTKKSR